MRMPLAVALVTISLLAGCAGSPTSDTVVTDAAPPSASAPETAQDDCGGAAAKIEQHLTTQKVSKVQIQGQCTSAIIRTTLGDEATEAARQLCETAAEVAYVGDLNAVTVLGSSGRELAIGISGMKCMASQ